MASRFIKFLVVEIRAVKRWLVSFLVAFVIVFGSIAVWVGAKLMIVDYVIKETTMATVLMHSDTLASEGHFINALKFSDFSGHDPALFPILRMLAILYEGNRNFDRAMNIEEFLLRLDLQNGSLADLARDSHMLGREYRKQRMFARSEPLLRRAVGLEVRLSPDSDVENTLASMDMLAWVLAQQGKHEAATKVVGDQIAYGDQRLDKSSLARAWPYANLAWMEASKGNKQQLNSDIDQALKIYKDAPKQPKYDVENAITCNLLGNLCRDQGRLDDALFFFDMAKVVCDGSIARSNLFYADIYQAQAKTLKLMGRDKEAAEFLDKATEIRKFKRPFRDHLPFAQLGI